MRNEDGLVWSGNSGGHKKLLNRGWEEKLAEYNDEYVGEICERKREIKNDDNMFFLTCWRDAIELWWGSQ